MTRRPSLALPLVVATAAAIAGCGGSSSPATPASPAPTTAAASESIYVLDAPAPPQGASIDRVLVSPDFSTVTIATQITGAATGLRSPVSLARSPDGDLYALEGTTPRIDVFAASATGNVAPKASITGAATGLSTNGSLAFDAAGDLYVALSDAGTGANPRVERFAPGATGNAAPAGIIEGAATMLVGPTAVAVDGGGTIYVADGAAAGVQTNVEVFAPATAGNVAPEATIAPGSLPADATGFSPSLLSPTRLTAAGSLLYAVSPGAPNILEFGFTTGPGPAVAATTVRDIIAPSTTTNLPSYSGIAVDPTGRIFVADPGNRTIDVFSATATGSAGPLAQLAAPFGMQFVAPQAVVF